MLAVLGITFPIFAVVARGYGMVSRQLVFLPADMKVLIAFVWFSATTGPGRRGVGVMGMTCPNSSFVGYALMLIALTSPRRCRCSRSSRCLRGRCATKALPRSTTLARPRRVSSS